MADTSFFNKTGTPSSDPSQFTVDDHGLLSGLGDDDHLQYHNDTRGDARYYGKSAVDAALAGKAATSHAHVISDTTGLQTALDGKAASSHTHTLADITDAGTAAAANTSDFATAAQGALAETALQSASFATVASTGLYSDLLSIPTSFTPSTHTHVIGDTTGLQTALDGKAATVHTHVINDTTGLQTALDGKSDTGHTHTFAALTSKPTTVSGFGITDAYTKTEVDTSLSGKAASSHTHAISDVTSLQTALDGKAASSHTHTASAITDFSEAVDDRVAGLLVAGTNVTLTYDDVANSLTLASTASGLSASAANTFTAKQTFSGDSSTTAPINLSVSYVPATPVNGDMWFNNNRLFYRQSSTSYQVPRVDLAQSWSAKQTFSGSASSANTLLTPLTADPSSLVTGDIWLRSSGDLKWYVGTTSYTAAPLASPVFTGTVTTPSVTFSGGPTLSTGSGSPESIVTAPIGSLYTRTDGTPQATLYVKTSGIGNTGWSAIGPLSGAKWSDT